MYLRIAILLSALALLAGCSNDEPVASSSATGASTASSANTPATEAAQTAAASEDLQASDAPADAPAADAAPARQTAADRAVAEGNLQFREGQHYIRLRPQGPTSTEGDRVEVAEVFMYSCPGCYRFEPFVQGWEEAKADYVNFVRIPLIGSAMQTIHAQAYYAAVSLGVIDEMHQAFFDEIHVQGNYLDTQGKLVEFFGRYGVDEEEFFKHFNSMAVRLKVSRAGELVNLYQVPGTPSIVVAGKYRTGEGIETYGQWFEVIDELAAMEYAEKTAD